MRLQRVLLISLAALTLACGGPSQPSSPTAPGVPAVNSTTYSGQYRVTSCGSLCGYVGSWPFTLTITRNGEARTAVLRTEPWGLEATLSGQEQPGGVMMLKGTAPSASPMVAGADFDLVIQEDAAQGLSGSFSYRVRRPGQADMAITAEVVSASMTSLAPGSTDFSGTWVTTGRTERLCTSDWGCTDPALGVLLVKQGAGYAGLAQLATRGAQRLSIGVTGTVEGGSLVLRGSLPKSPGQLLDIGQELTLALRILPSGQLVGDYDLIESQGNYSASQRGALLGGARRANAPSGSLDGEWYGWVLHESCTGNCQSLHSSNFRITLTQSGSSVQGMYATEFPLTGTASGATFVIEGGDTNPGCISKGGTVCSESLRFVITGIDQWGMLSGTGSHTWNGRFEVYTKTGRLWNYTRQIK